MTTEEKLVSARELLNRSKKFYNDAQAEVHALELLRAEERYGVKIGSEVLSKGKRYQVTQIYNFGAKPWVKGNPQKVNGMWGFSEQHLYTDWELA